MKCNAKFQAICMPRNDCGCLNLAISGMSPCQTPTLIPSNQRMSTTVQYPLACWLIGPSPATTRPANLSMPWCTAQSPKMGRGALPQAAEYAQLGVLPAGRCRLLLRPARNLAVCHRQFGYRPCRSGRYPAKRLHAACRCFA